MTKKFFKLNDIVPQSGVYVCVPCGYEQYFESGEKFPVCSACFAGTQQGPERYDSPEAEFWKASDHQASGVRRDDPTIRIKL